MCSNRNVAYQSDEGCEFSNYDPIQIMISRVWLLSIEYLLAEYDYKMRIKPTILYYL